MKFKLKDPGSAITHGIAFLLAAAGAAPLLIRAAGCTDHLHLAALSIFILTMMLLYAARHYLPLRRFYRKSQPQAAQDGSYDDLCNDRRQLHTCMSDRPS